jgi:hypothetical protein
VDMSQDINAGKPYLVPELHENLHDDPYGTASYVVRRVLRDAMDLKGTMSEGEYKNLKDIEEVVRALDNS